MGSATKSTSGEALLLFSGVSGRTRDSRTKREKGEINMEIGELIDEYGPAFEFLESLRLSGVTNMYGATPFMVQFGLGTSEECMKMLSIWMKNYDDLSIYYRWGE